MKFVDVPLCPVTGEPGDVAITDISDRYFGTPGHWRYRRDARTGHLWLDPRPNDEDVGELYRTYYTHDAAASQVEQSLWQQAIGLALARRLRYPDVKGAGPLAKLVSHLPSVADAAELEMMRVHASERGSLLDVGCGNGQLMQRMHRAGWQVTGTEPDPKAAANLRTTFGFRVFGSLDEVDATSCGFDLISLSHVIEHLPDPVSALRRLSGLLAPGGRMVVTTPNVGSMGARMFGALWRGLEPPRHFNVFTVRSLGETLAGAGLSATRISTHARLARGMFYVSMLARRGHSCIESQRMPQRRGLTLLGYAFQLLEAAAIRIAPTSGEEIFCVAVIAPASEPR